MVVEQGVQIIVQLEGFSDQVSFIFHNSCRSLNYFYASTLETYCIHANRCASHNRCTGPHFTLAHVDEM